MLRRDQPDEGPRKLKDVLSQLFVERGWGRRQARLHVERAWEAAAGAAVARKTRVGAVRRGVLEVEVANAPLMQELNDYHKKRLLTEMKKRLPGEGITALRFRAGSFETDDTE